MNIPRIQRGDPNNAYASLRNVGSTLADMSVGHQVMFAITGDTIATGYTWIPGVDVIPGTAAGAKRSAGIVAKKAIPAGEYGMVLIYGYISNAKTTASPLAAGTDVKADDASAVVAGVDADNPSLVMGVCLKTGVGTAAGVLVRRM